MRKNIFILLIIFITISLIGCSSLQASIATKIDDIYGEDEKSYEEYKDEYQAEWDEFYNAWGELADILRDEVSNETSKKQDSEPETNAPEEKQENDKYYESVNSFLNSSKYSHAAQWDGDKTPDESPHMGWGCNAYAADFVKIVFNHDSPKEGERFSNADDIRAGDVLHFNEGTYYDEVEKKVKEKKPHWVVVISRDGNKIKTAEGNWTVNGKAGVVRVSETAYTIENNTVYHNGKPFRILADAYHHAEE